jgi:hypothetical protein
MIARLTIWKLLVTVVHINEVVLPLWFGLSGNLQGTLPPPLKP